MKIVHVETFPLFYPLKQPYGDANGYKHYRSSFLIRVTTQSGLTGWGECTDWLPALKLGFEERVIPYLIGKQASERGQLVRHIQKWHSRSASGVSMALTEIAAKKAGLSVCELWGGRMRDEVPVYASFQSYSERVDWMAHSLHLIEQAMGQGFRQMKVKIGGRALKDDLKHVRQVQDLLQENGELMLDANESYDLATARAWEREFSNWRNLLWLEEPMPMKQTAQYRMLRSCLSVPVAGGENLQSAAAFLPLLRNEVVDIIQPDVAHEEGVDSYRHTLQLARTFGLRVSPHTFDGALARLYALFAQACLPPWSKMSEQDIEPVEWDEMENPFTSLIPLQPVGGKVTIPTGIGIGVEPDQHLIEKYRWDGSVYR